MPPVNDGTVSRNTFLGSDDDTQATYKKGYGGIVARNTKRLFDFEVNEMQDTLFDMSKDLSLLLLKDGIFVGDVFDNGEDHDSFKVTYESSVLTVAAGKGKLGPYLLHLFSDIANTGGNATPGLSSFVLPVSGLAIIYIDIYDREVETNGSNPYIDATTVSNGNDPYLVSPVGEETRRYQFFNYRTDICAIQAPMPVPVDGHHYLILAVVLPDGTVTDARQLASQKPEAILGSSPLALSVISGGLITQTAAEHSLAPESGISDTLTNAPQKYARTAQLLLLRVDITGNAITIQHLAGGGNEFYLAGGVDVILTDHRQSILFSWGAIGSGIQGWIEVCRNFSQSGAIGYGANTQLAITSNVIYPIHANHTLAAGAINTIDQTHINDGGLLLLVGTDSQVTTIANAAGGTGQVKTFNSAKYTFSSSRDYLLLQRVGTTFVEVARSGAASSSQTFEGRFATYPGSLPVMGMPVNADSGSVGFVALAPCRGNVITLYNGSAWVAYKIPDAGVTLHCGSTGMYDVFVYDNGGTLTLEQVIWTNDVTRAAELAVQDGVYVKTSDSSRRYIGSYKSISNIVKDEEATRHIWSYYNRVDRWANKFMSGAGYAYSTATLRQVNNSNVNQFEVVIGVAEDITKITYEAMAQLTSGGPQAQVGIGIDSTSADSSTVQIIGGYISSATAYAAYTKAEYLKILAPGNHVIAALEEGNGTATTTWIGGGYLHATYKG